MESPLPCRHFHRCLTVALAVGLTSFYSSDSRAADAPAPPKVKLAVLVVFDQMRGDYLDKWRPLFGPGGFDRLQTDGAWFDHCYYPYGTTTTGPGHASFLTGTCPDRHGIVNNNWHDRKAGDDAAEEGGVYCRGLAAYQLVPGSRDKKAKAKPVGNPDRLLSETLADVLKEATGGRAKVFGLSLKDRSAILPDRQAAGRGVLVRRASSSPRPTTATASAAVGRRRSTPTARPTAYFGKPWEPVPAGPRLRRSTAARTTWRARARGPAQGVGVPAPDLRRPATSPASEYYTALANSPFGNDLLLDFAKACVVDGAARPATTCRTCSSSASRRTT